MNSNIHIYWDGPIMAEEQTSIRQWLGRAVLDGEFSVCRCHLTLLMIGRGHLPGSYIVELACECGSLAIEAGKRPFLISFRSRQLETGDAVGRTAPVSALTIPSQSDIHTL
jgi:hypothetical protein